MNGSQLEKAGSIPIPANTWVSFSLHVQDSDNGVKSDCGALGEKLVAEDKSW